MQDSENVCKNWYLLSGPHLENFHSPDKNPFIWKILQITYPTKDLYPEHIKNPQNSKGRIDGYESSYWGDVSVLKLGYSDKLIKLIELYT